MSFSCYESDASSCPTTPSSQESSQTPRTSRENNDAYYALLAENELLRNELKSFAERLEELETQADINQKGHHQAQSPKDWIRANLEEAQHLIDSIVGIKGITEGPLNAAIKMGISQPQPAPKHELELKAEPKTNPNQKPTGEEMFYETYQYYDHQKKQPQPQPQPQSQSRVSISSEELFGY
jgi:hypothetical protein